jgi:Cysteine-rich secretory protein family
MKFICFLIAMTIAAASARAEDITAMISQYRREHGLPAVKTDPKLTAVAERQAKAMAASGIMDHDVAGSFASRIRGAETDSSAENIAAGTKTWADTLRLWKTSPGHNANLLYPGADLLGVAVAHNENTRYKTYWAMVIGHKSTKVRTRTASGYMWGASGADSPDDSKSPEGAKSSGGSKSTEGSKSREGSKSGSTAASASESSVGTMLMRALSPLKNLLP